MCDLDGDGPEFWVDQVRRANKVHKCQACGERIDRGHRYEVISAKWDGSVETFKRCLRCRAMARGLRDVLGESIDVLLDCGADPMEPGKYPQLDELAFWVPGERVGESR